MKSIPAVTPRGHVWTARGDPPFPLFRPPPCDPALTRSFQGQGYNQSYGAPQSQNSYSGPGVRTSQAHLPLSLSPSDVLPVQGAGDWGGSIGGISSIEDEPPLLEELGIDFLKIYQKTVSVLNPMVKVKEDMLYTRCSFPPPLPPTTHHRAPGHRRACLSLSTPTVWCGDGRL